MQNRKNQRDKQHTQEHTANRIGGPLQGASRRGAKHERPNQPAHTQPAHDEGHEGAVEGQESDNNRSAISGPEEKQVSQKPSGQNVS